MRHFAAFIMLSAFSASAAQAEGGRVEIHGGYDRLDYDSFFSPSDFTYKPTEGAVLGASLGYDIPISGPVFAGIEASADFSTGSRCQVNPLVLAPGIFESCLSLKRDLGANARIGVNLANDRTRLYALAGYSNLLLETSFQINRQPPTSLRSETRDGLRLGAGIEHNLGKRFYGKIEYRYTDYGDGIVRSQGLVGAGLRF